MSEENLTRRRRAFVGSYFGLLLGWLGLLILAGVVALALRELHVFTATWTQLEYWGSMAVGGTAVLYALTMFALTWSFARRINVQFLPAVAFAIWGAMPVCNLIPFALLLLLAARRDTGPPAAEV